MRIALSYPGCHRRGGIERIMLECANFLYERGHETHVYSSDWDQSHLLPGIVRHHVPLPVQHSFLSHLLLFARQSRQAVRRLRPPVDVAGTFGVQSPPGGVMWVQSVHKAWLDTSSRHRSRKGRLKQKLNLFHPSVLALEHDHFARRKYKKLIALSAEVKADLMRWYRVPGDDIVIIPNGFSPKEFSAQCSAEARSAVRRKLGYNESDKVIIFVANELERKGFGPLFRAISLLNDSHVHLLAVGRIKPQAYLPEIQSMGLSERVQFVGPTSEIATYYAAADVFALPTQYEAWGMVIVEALACGLPVLTSRLAGAAVTVHEGETGYLLDDPRSPEEIAAKLWPLLRGLPASREAISASVEAYAWPRLLLRYEQTLAECLEWPARGAA